MLLINSLENPSMWIYSCLNLDTLNCAGCYYCLTPKCIWEFSVFFFAFISKRCYVIVITLFRVLLASSIIIYSQWRQRWWCLHQGFSRNLICIVEVGGEEFNISVMSFGVGGERNLSRPCRNVRSGSKCKEISALVTLCRLKLIWWHGIIGQCVKLLEQT